MGKLPPLEPCGGTGCIRGFCFLFPPPVRTTTTRRYNFQTFYRFFFFFFSFFFSAVLLSGGDRDSITWFGGFGWAGRTGGGWGGGGVRGVSLQALYLTLHCHHENNPALRWTAMRAVSTPSFIVRGKVTRLCPHITVFVGTGEPKPGTEPTPSACQRNALFATGL